MTNDLIFPRRLILDRFRIQRDRIPDFHFNPEYQFPKIRQPFNEAYSGDAGKVFFPPLEGALNWIYLKVGET